MIIRFGSWRVCEWAVSANTRDLQRVRRLKVYCSFSPEDKAKTERGRDEFICGRELTRAPRGCRQSLKLAGSPLY